MLPRRKKKEKENDSFVSKERKGEKKNILTLCKLQNSCDIYFLVYAILFVISKDA